MHSIDRATCRNIAYILLGIYVLINAGWFFVTVPEGNKESLSRSTATIENLLLIMAGFFYGASVSKKQDSTGEGALTEQVRVTETKTKEEIKPKVDTTV